MIWQQGYNSGSLVAPLFDDVESALKTWHQQGLILAVYSSGSVTAQQLLYGNSIAGDLRGLFTSWFDTRLGSKVNSQSYIDLAKQLAIPAAQLLFISDAPDELKAAKNADLQVCGSQRPGNIQIINADRYKIIKKFSELELTNALN
jgi:enolase-phosphatase E1